MQIQKITQLGNSNAVILPTPIMHEAKLKRGQKITVDYLAEADVIVMRRIPNKSIKPTRSEKEFQAWLASFLQEDKELLDELADR